MERTFIEVAGFPKYGVSDDGVVINFARNSVLKPYLDASGYKRVVLQAGGLRRSVKIIELVAQAFVVGIHPDDRVKNISHDRSDVRLSNIEVVCTHMLVTAYGENTNYGTVYDVAKRFDISVEDVKMIISRRKRGWTGPLFDYINTVSR